MILSFDATLHAETMASLGRAITGLQETLDTLDQEVGALRGQWSGAAQAAYDNAHQQWASPMARLHAALQDATDAARSAGDRLTQTEAEVTALWA